MMRPLEDVIAECRLQLVRSTDITDVMVQLGRPYADHMGTWLCPMQVASADRVIARVASGGDSFGALRIALQMIRQELVDDLPRASGGAVRVDPRFSSNASADDLFPNQFPFGA